MVVPQGVGLVEQGETTALRAHWQAAGENMTPGTAQTYLEPTQESGRAFFSRGITGSVVVLNLLRFRVTADYSASPELAPPAPITAAEENS